MLIANNLKIKKNRSPEKKRKKESMDEIDPKFNLNIINMKTSRDNKKKKIFQIKDESKVN